MSGGVKEGKLATPEATDAHPLLRMTGPSVVLVVAAVCSLHSTLLQWQRCLHDAGWTQPGRAVTRQHAPALPATLRPATSQCENGPRSGELKRGCEASGTLSPSVIRNLSGWERGGRYNLSHIRYSCRGQMSSYTSPVPVSQGISQGLFWDLWASGNTQLRPQAKGWRGPQKSRPFGAPSLSRFSGPVFSCARRPTAAPRTARLITSSPVTSEERQLRPKHRLECAPSQRDGVGLRQAALDDHCLHVGQLEVDHGRESPCTSLRHLLVDRWEWMVAWGDPAVRAKPLPNGERQMTEKHFTERHAQFLRELY